VLAGVADRKLSAFPDALAGAEWTGNPVRGDIAAIAEPRARFGGRNGPLRLLIVGGSLGAQALNECLPKALALIPEPVRPSVTHQAGEKHLDALQGNYRAAGVQAETVAFIGDMARRYAEADLVICRAGAMTVSELAAGGMASVLVPFPHAVDDHQTANARFLADQGAAVLVSQKDLSPNVLAELIRSFTREKLLEMALKARALGKPEATRIVADRCAALASGKAA
jgi:UDP-N-acetylglucosamine--N-acetylmuramyl-(pentapeptide) pyrophosphoryl-undecaprenol N-acetylglucosamine transferase